MDYNSNLYTILDVQQDALPEEIRKAFRKQALIHHPDKNSGSEKAQLQFRIIKDAYEILSNPESRREYDTYLETSLVFTKNRTAPFSRKKQSIAEDLCDRMNYILWEIEDLLQGNNNPERIPDVRIHPWLMQILAFFDEKILEPAGFPDYFYEARQIRADRYTDRVIKSPERKSHKPYINIKDNFYQIRKRMDRMIAQITDKNLSQKNQTNGIILLDAIFEGLKLAYHYLGGIQLYLSGKNESVPTFAHTDPRFSDTIQGMINL